MISGSRLLASPNCGSHPGNRQVLKADQDQASTRPPPPFRGGGLPVCTGPDFKNGQRKKKKTQAAPARRHAHRQARARGPKNPVRTGRLSGLSGAPPLATLFIPFTNAAAESANAIALHLAGSSALSRFGR